MDGPWYCSTCGCELVEVRVEGRQRAYCRGCDRVQYRNPKPCAGVLVVDGDRLLLIERTEPPAPGSWSVPAGYLEHDEPPQSAAVRELAEETTIEISEDAIELFDTAFVRHPDGRHVRVLLYLVAASEATGDPNAGGDDADVRYWTLSELRASEERIEPGYETQFERAVETITIRDR